MQKELRKKIKEGKIHEEDGGPVAAEKHQWSLEKPKNRLRAEDSRLPGCGGSDVGERH